MKQIKKLNILFTGKDEILTMTGYNRVLGKIDELVTAVNSLSSQIDPEPDPAFERMLEIKLGSKK